jgi:2,4-dienoyl-CoA reductase-like NADH-dependent reductase (Old Yellow Enzyme family)
MMNERIQELIKQAMVLDDGELFVREVFDREKFAQLIVRECIDIVAAGGEFASRPKLVEKLQEHFGVEE